MHRRQLLALAASASAGCLRLTGDETPTAGSGSASATAAATGAGSEQPTVTDPARSTETSVVSYPLGLSSTGVDNAGFLFSANVDALRQTNFRAKWVKLDRSNGRVKWRKEYRGDHETTLGRWTGISGGELTIYRYPLGNYWREDLGDRFTYGNEQSDNQGYAPAVWGIELSPLLHVGDWSAPARVNENRPVIWELSTDTVASSTPVPGYHLGEVVSIANASFRVDERGIIRSVVAAYQIRERDGEELAYEIDYQLDSLGEISITAPEWLSTAKEQAPMATASLTPDRRFIDLTIDSGNRIEADSIIFVGAQDDRGFFLRLDEPLDPNVSAFLYKPQSAAEVAPAKGRIARGTPPSDADPVELTSGYSLGARRRATHYFEMIDVRDG